MNKKAISYKDFLYYIENEQLVLTSGIKENWSAERHIDYIIELQNNGNANNVQFILTYTGQLRRSIDVIISLSTQSIITFRFK